MDASSQSFTALITNAAQRFVIPVYQRPYSWDEEQCEQLWDDVLSIGRRGEGTHFTGSVVWVQDGIMPASGITPVLLIDGQQRMTTLTLLLVALADYAKDHPDEDLGFSREEILNTYLVNQYKQNEDHWKLTLSQSDLPTLRAIVGNIEEDDSILVADEESRLVQNLNLFKRRLESLEDPSSVWLGIQRLEIVSISLAQGRDNPQLIFESMNSTGKTLSSADLIRNFVLMGQTRDEQDKLYRNHWRKIEDALGANTYDVVFDEFVRNYLTVLYAPESLAKRDVYPLFKRHVFDNGYDKEGRIVELLDDLARFAGYYASITRGVENDGELKSHFDRIARLEMGVANPLLLSFYDDYDHNAFGHEDFVAILDMLESYLFRRAVCDCASNALNKFFSSLIGRLNKVQDDGGNYREAFTAMLLNEAGTSRRFPGDSEFVESLKIRDSYHFKKSLYLLSRLENSFHPKDPRDFATGTYTIEHIMPQNALAHEEWKEALGPEAAELHEKLVNTLGNLTLTAYNSELSDGTFEDKKARLVGGYDNEFISISADLKERESWDDVAIAERAAYLADRAIDIWKIPALPDDVCRSYLPEKKSSEPSRIIKFKDLFNAGFIAVDEKLLSGSQNYEGSAVVTDEGSIRLENGEEYASPSLAAARLIALRGGSGARNGWSFWKLEDGRELDSLRKDYLGSQFAEESQWLKKRVLYWDGFYDYCSGLPEFVEAYGDQSYRQTNKDSWARFGIGFSACHPDALIAPYFKSLGVDLYCTDIDAYKKILDFEDEFRVVADALGGELKIDAIDMPDKKNRTIAISRSADFDKEDWEDLYAWQATSLLRVRAIALKALG